MITEMKISIELENKVKDISQEVRQRAKEATTWEKTITMIIFFFLEPNSFLHCMNFQIEGFFIIVIKKIKKH